MCRFSAIISTRPVAIADIVTRPKTSIIYQSYNCRERVHQTDIQNSYQVSSLNGDGYGVGWYVPEELRGVTEAPNEPCIFVSARPAWTDLNLVSIAEKTASRTVFAHVRAASTGYVSEGSCHPFKNGRFMFMHNGMIGEWDRIRAKAIRLLPEKLFDWVLTQNGTDSVFMFALFLAFLPRSSSEKHRPEEIRMAFANMVDFLIAMHTILGIQSNSMINICISDGDTTIASRLLIGGSSSLMSSEYIRASNAVDASLYYASGSSWEVDQSDELGTASSESRLADTDYRMSQKDRQQNAVIISSEPLSSSIRREWVPVNPQHVIIVDKNCNVLQEEIQDCPWRINDLSIEILTSWLDWMYRSKDPNVTGLEPPSFKWNIAGLPLNHDRYSIYNNTVLEHCLSAMDFTTAETAPDGTVSYRTRLPSNLIDLSFSSPMSARLYQGAHDPQQPLSMGCNQVLTSDGARGCVADNQTHRPSDKTVKSERNPAYTLRDIEMYDSKNKLHKLLVAGHDTGLIRIWELSTGSCIAETSHETSHLACVRSLKSHWGAGCMTNPDSSPLLISGSSDSTLRIWDLSFLKDILAQLDQDQSLIEYDSPCSSQNENEQCIISMSYIAMIEFEPLVGGILGFEIKDEYLVLGLWNTNIYRIRMTDLVECLKDGKLPSVMQPWLWTVTNEPNVSEFECRTRDGPKLIAEKFYYTNQVRHVGFVECIVDIPDTGTIVTAGADGIMIFWDFANAAVAASTHKIVLSGHPGRIYSLAHAPNRGLLVSGGQYGRLRIWDVKTGACLGTALHKGVEYPVVTTCISGDKCIIGSTSGAISLLDLNRLVYEMDLVDFRDPDLSAQNHIVTSRSSNGRLNVCAAGVDGLVRIWRGIQCNDDESADPPEIYYPRKLTIRDSISSVIEFDVETILRDMIPIRSISGSSFYLKECYEASRYLSTKLDALGCIVRQAVGEKGGAPVLLGRLGSNPNRPTLLFYGHYDVVAAPITPTNPSRSRIYGSLKYETSMCGASVADKVALSSSTSLASPDPEYESSESSCDMHPRLLTKSNNSWGSDPWQLVQKNGFYYGRGVCDNKGPICAQLAAVSNLLKEIGPDIGLNIMFLYEGNEETGSNGVIHALDEMRELFELTPIDAVIFNNAAGVSQTTPSLITAMRGVIDFRIEITARSQDQRSFISDESKTPDQRSHVGWHSGEKGGGVIEPMWLMVKLLSRLVNDSGEVTIPGIDPNGIYEYFDQDKIAIIEKEIDDFCESLAEKKFLEFFNGAALSSATMRDVFRSTWLKPNISIGEIYSSASSPNQNEWSSNFRIMPSTVGCNISLRIVAWNSKQQAMEAVQSYISRCFNEHHPEQSCSLNVRFEQVHDPWDCTDGKSTDADRLISLAKDALTYAWNKNPFIIREGGTMPMLTQLQQLTGAPTLNIPLAGPGDNAHLPNERINCLTLGNARRTLEYLMKKMPEAFVK